MQTGMFERLTQDCWERHAAKGKRGISFAEEDVFNKQSIFCTLKLKRDYRWRLRNWIPLNNNDADATEIESRELILFFLLLLLLSLKSRAEFCLTVSFTFFLTCSFSVGVSLPPRIRLIHQSVTSVGNGARNESDYLSTTTNNNNGKLIMASIEKLFNSSPGWIVCMISCRKSSC